MGVSFDSSGLLLPGTYVLELDEFLDIFCRDEQGGHQLGSLKGHESVRAGSHSTFRSIYSWARRNDATSIVVGGSFVSKKQVPNDIDVLVFFTTSSLIPKSSEVCDIDGVRVDIQMLAEDQSEIKDAFLELLSTSRSGIRHGLVQIKFHELAAQHSAPSKRSRDYEVVKAGYMGRHLQLQTAKGVIVPIHGIRTHADWMPHLSLFASATGWAVAPYVYGYQGVSILRNETDKRKVVEGFRDWIATVRSNFDGPISVIAHSFGTYVVGRYLQEAKDIAGEFDAVILCGSILNKDYKWNDCFDSGKVGRVLNVVSEADEWVKHMPEGGVRWIMEDSLFGKAGCEGFSCENERLQQFKSALLAHNNIFKVDVIKGVWLPFLKLARNSLSYYSWEAARPARLEEQVY